MSSVVLVTGASRGLGRGIAVELAKAGYSVAINYAGNIKAAEECKRLCEDGQINSQQNFITVKADISQKQDREAMLETIINEMGGLDALVNNAGIAPPIRGDLLEATTESFDKVIQTNLAGPYFTSQLVANYWLEKKSKTNLKGGHKLIFVTSISSHTASVSRGDYCLSKAALSMAVKLFATRLAEHNVQVYELRPGIMKTDMTIEVTEKYDKLIADGLVPQNRWGTPEDLGLAAKTLIDGEFPFSTGTVIDVDGGFHLKTL